MKLSFNKLLVLISLLFTFSTYAKKDLAFETVTLTSNTNIPVRLAQNINGNLDNQGDTIYFEVIDDIEVDNKVVIKKGTFVKGKITSAESRKSMGKAGSLAIQARSLKAVDGQMVEFTRDTMTSEGRKRTGATVAHVLMWGPVGLFAKGRAARIMLDSEYDLEVRNNVNIKPVINLESDYTDRTQAIDVFFFKYKSKINYAKGKVGKDFYLNIKLPQSASINAKDISIIEVNDNKLPKSIHPTEVNWNNKSNTFTAKIAFRDMVKYIAPGSSNVVVQVNNNDTLFQGAASVLTKWKLK